MNSTSIGFLMVNVRYAKGAAPVAGAAVTVKRMGETVGEFFTDGGGKTEKLPLSVGEDYGVAVYADGFERAEITHIPVTGGITTLQNLCLFPAVAEVENNDGQI